MPQCVDILYIYVAEITDSNLSVEEMNFSDQL